jgi:uncharacterized delta-60 repeat protein
MNKHTSTRSGTRRLLQRCLMTAAITFAVAPFARAAAPGHPGDTDPGFGSGGYLTTDFFGTNEQINAVAPLADGRFYVAGVVTSGNADGSGSSLNMALARYLPNGALDADFGSGGLFDLDIDGATDEAHAVIPLADGGVLLAGSLSTDSHADFGVVKVTADGTLDTTFGEDDAGTARTGWVRLDIGGADIHDDAFAMALQSDGRIVVAGITRVFHDGFHYAQVAVARFTADGRVDTGFGGAGTGHVVLAPFFGAAADALSAIALTQSGRLPADDRITIAGYTPNRNNAFLARLTANGTVDAGFGTNGRVLISADNSGGVQRGISILADARMDARGRIVVLGEGGDRGLTFLRYGAAGALDTTFGTDGRTTVKFSGVADYDEPAALALQGNGKPVAAGYATSRDNGAPHADFFVVRLTADGAIDAGFGDGQGRSKVQVSADDDGALAIGVEPTGNLLVGGYRRPAGSTTQQSDFAVLRLFGDPDRIFANAFD